MDRQRRTLAQRGADASTRRLAHALASALGLGAVLDIPGKADARRIKIESRPTAPRAARRARGQRVCARRRGLRDRRHDLDGELVQQRHHRRHRRHHRAVALCVAARGRRRHDRHDRSISNNFSGSTPLDSARRRKVGNSIFFTVSNNFVGFPDANSAGEWSYTGGCARLGPLRDNGGPTWTHALLGNSPAIDKGDNIDALPYDQRGPAYARDVDGFTDIGAYQLQAEEIFGAGFDDC